MCHPVRDGEPGRNLPTKSRARRPRRESRSRSAASRPTSRSTGRRRQRDAFLLDRADVICSGAPFGNFWRQRCELPPTVAPKYIHVRPATRRPRARALRSHLSPAELPRRDEPARLIERVGLVHLDDENGPAIRRRIGVVRHRALVRRKVDLPRFRAALRRGHNPHVEVGLDLGKENVLIGHPRETGGVGEHSRRLSPEHRHRPRVPQQRRAEIRLVYAIRDPSGVNTGAYLPPASLVSRTDRRWAAT